MGANFLGSFDKQQRKLRRLFDHHLQTEQLATCLEQKVERNPLTSTDHHSVSHVARNLATWPHGCKWQIMADNGKGMDMHQGLGQKRGEYQ